MCSMIAWLLQPTNNNGIFNISFTIDNFYTPNGENIHKKMNKSKKYYKTNKDTEEELTSSQGEKTTSKVKSKNKTTTNDKEDDKEENEENNITKEEIDENLDIIFLTLCKLHLHNEKFPIDPGKLYHDFINKKN